MSRYKDCVCHTCDRLLHHLGVARHRAMHRDRHELCRITYTHGDTYVHDYRKPREEFVQPTEVGW